MKVEVELKNCKAEVTDFLIMCNEHDRDFLKLAQSDRKTDDYVRLMCIARILGFKNVLKRLIIELDASDKKDEILTRFEEIERDNSVIIKWMDEFVEQIKVPLYKNLLKEEWEEEKARIKKDNKIF